MEDCDIYFWSIIAGNRKLMTYDRYTIWVECKVCAAMAHCFPEKKKLKWVKKNLKTKPVKII